MAPTAGAELLAQLIARPAWQADALCREYPEVSFYPRKGESTGPAKAICARCSVQDECRRYALEHETLNGGHGIWAGTSALDRRRLREGRAA